MVNGHGELPESPASIVAPPAPTSKKGKKKATDPNETGKLLAAKINQLELDAAGEKDQEAEIGTYQPRSASALPVGYLSMTPSTTAYLSMNRIC